MEEALESSKPDPQPFIIGGGEIYAQGMAVAKKIELTRVHATFDADTFFPDIPESDWELVEEHYHPIDDRHDYAFTYETWIRR
jgi:dihydrofolate reductase